MDEIICLDDDDDQRVEDAGSGVYEDIEASLDAEGHSKYGSVIVKGQDVYYIKEIDDNEAEQPFEYVIQEVPSGQDVSGEVTQAIMNETADVDSFELSEIWNDLINANQEILILLELNDLKLHIMDAKQIEDTLSELPCEFCDIISPNLKFWNYHNLMHFGNQPFTCEHCDMKFLFYNRFRDHLNVHVGNKPYKCDECHHNYSFRRSLLVHKILDHIKIDGIYICRNCNLDCRSSNSLKQHIATHIENESIPPPPPSAPTASHQDKFLEAFQSYNQVAPTYSNIRFEED